MSLVLLHAIGLDAESWKFAQIPRGIPMDLAGFGEPLPADGLSEPAMADDIVARAEAGPLDVVGVSLGAQVALQIGLRHPDRVRSLVIAGTGPAVDPNVMLQRAAAARAQGMEAQAAFLLERWFTPAAVAAGHPAVEYARDRLRRDDPEAFAAAWSAIAQHNVRDRLGELRVPVTVIGGTVDQAAPLEHVRALHAGIQGSRLVVLEGPHLLYMECAEAFRKAVLDHLEWASRR